MVRACQPLWPFGNDEVYQQFTYVTHTELAWHLTPHGGWQCRLVPVTEVSRQSRGTLSPKLHTQPLPVEHVWIGNCRSHNRSQFQAPYFGAWDTTRQERALLPSLLYVRHAMGSSTCRTISVSLGVLSPDEAPSQTLQYHESEMQQVKQRSSWPAAGVYVSFARAIRRI